MIAASFVLAACGAKGAAHPRPATTACPTGDALTAAALHAWNHEGDLDGGGEAYPSCAELVAGGEALWVIDGFLTTGGEDGTTLSTWTAIVTPAGEVRILQGEGGLPPGAIEHRTDDAWRAADLDGDGDDELLHEIGYSHMGYESAALHVFRVRGRELVPIGDGIALGDDNTGSIMGDDPDEPAPHACTAAWTLVAAGKGQLVDVTYGGEGECPNRGRHAWRLDGDTLVAAP